MAGQRDQPDQRRVGVPRVRGRLVLPGVNDFASAFPALAAQWPPDEKQRPAPRTGGGQQQPVRLVAVRAGAYVAGPVGRRVQFATGCPYCTGRKVLPGFNDLASLEPQVAAQWDTERNGSSAPTR